MFTEGEKLLLEQFIKLTDFSCFYRLIKLFKLKKWPQSCSFSNPKSKTKTVIVPKV